MFEKDEYKTKKRPGMAHFLKKNSGSGSGVAHLSERRFLISEVRSSNPLSFSPMPCFEYSKSLYILFFVLSSVLSLSEHASTVYSFSITNLSLSIYNTPSFAYACLSKQCDQKKITKCPSKLPKNYFTRK